MITQNLIQNITKNITSSLTGESPSIIPPKLVGHFAAFESGFTPSQLFTKNVSEEIEAWINIAPDATQDAVQTDASRKPIYTPNSINTNPAVSFDGNNDILVAPFMINPADGFTLFLIHNLSDAGTGQTLVDQDGAGAPINLLAVSGAEAFVSRLGAGGNSASTAGGVIDFTPQLLTITFNKASKNYPDDIIVWIDNVRYSEADANLTNNVGQADGSSNVAGNSTGSILIGEREDGNFPTLGLIGEVQLWTQGTQGLTEAEIISKNSTLMTKWSIV